MFESRYGPQALSLLRIVAALLFLLHGTSKLFSFPPFPMDLPQPGDLLWIGAIIEIAGGLLLLVGFLSRPAAFIALGRDGGRLLDVPCAAIDLPVGQYGRAGDPVLLHFPADRGGGAGSVEHGRLAQPNRDPHRGFDRGTAALVRAAPARP